MLVSFKRCFATPCIIARAPGDNEPPSWQELFDMDGFVDSVKGSDILLAPHHGRESGFDPEVLSLINPRLTIVSDGPWVDTSATDLYSQISRGWTVHARANTLH